MAFSQVLTANTFWEFSGEKKGKVAMGEGCEVGGKLLTGVWGAIPVFPAALNRGPLTHPPAC